MTKPINTIFYSIEACVICDMKIKRYVWKNIKELKNPWNTEDKSLQTGDRRSDGSDVPA